MKGEFWIDDDTGVMQQKLTRLAIFQTVWNMIIPIAFLEQRFFLEYIRIVHEQL